MISLSLVNNTEILGSGNTVSSVGFGTAAPDRIVVVLGLTNDAVLSSGTLGGITTTQAQLDVGASRLAIWWANIPTGTSGNLVTAGANPTYTFGSYALYGAQPTFFAAGGTVAASTTLNTINAGAVIALSIRAPAAGVTWPVLSESPNGFDYTIASGGGAGTAAMSGAILTPTTTQTPMTVTATGASAVLAVSFEPNPVPRKLFHYQRLRRAA